MNRGTAFLFEIHGEEGDRCDRDRCRRLQLTATSRASMQRQELNVNGARGDAKAPARQATLSRIAGGHHLVMAAGDKSVGPRPAARPARLHVADGARTAVALRQMRRAGQGLARSGNFGRGIKYQACPSRRRDPRAVRFEFPVAVKRQPEIVVDR